MKVSKKERFKVGEQAALHLLRTSEADSPKTQAEFDAWARTSAHHVHELLFLDATSTHLDGMDANRSIDVSALPTGPELVSSIDEYEPELLVEHERRRLSSATRKELEPERASRLRRHWFSMAAAALLCVGVILAAFVLRENHSTYRTSLGEQRTVKLSDGSVMIINTGSRAEVDYSDRERIIYLREGEAFFTVAHDATRPFRVFAHGVITAVGTRFNVDRHTGKTRVAVIEGTIHVAAASDTPAVLPSDDFPDAGAAPGAAATMALRAGDEAVLDRGRVVKAADPDVRRAIAWQSRELIFRGNPLAEVVEEFNRYNLKKLRVEGNGPRMQNISGVFSADDVQTLIDFLADDPRFEVTRSESEIVIRSRDPALPAVQR